MLILLSPKSSKACTVHSILAHSSSFRLLLRKIVSRAATASVGEHAMRMSGQLLVSWDPVLGPATSWVVSTQQDAHTCYNTR
jgi:hypothetical protein